MHMHTSNQSSMPATTAHKQCILRNFMKMKVNTFATNYSCGQDMHIMYQVGVFWPVLQVAHSEELGQCITIKFLNMEKVASKVAQGERH